MLVLYILSVLTLVYLNLAVVVYFFYYRKEKRDLRCCFVENKYKVSDKKKRVKKKKIKHINLCIACLSRKLGSFALYLMPPFYLLWSVVGWWWLFGPLAACQGSGHKSLVSL